MSPNESDSDDGWSPSALHVGIAGFVVIVLYSVLVLGRLSFGLTVAFWLFGVYLLGRFLRLAVRLVRAVERIADAMERRDDAVKRRDDGVERRDDAVEYRGDER